MTEHTFYIKKIILHFASMELVNPFTTSFGTVRNRDMILVEAHDEIGTIGWGECVAFKEPWYTEETVQSAAHIMRDFLIPLILNQPLDHPDEVTPLFSAIRRNPMAKAAIEGAVWDIYAKRNNRSLSAALGGTRTNIEAGISIGLQDNEEDLYRLIDKSLEKGYKRVKLKIKPGMDIDLIKNVRKHFPDLSIMADANSAYTLKDTDRLKMLDAYNLLMIEQPLGYSDIVEHAILQKEITTPICLDESIQSYEDAKEAIALESCKVINLKIGRVGGLSESIKILNLCQEKNIAVWCGGMLESGISRAHNIALASLSQVNLPGDISSSSRYWQKDITVPPVVVENGYIPVPVNKGIGYEIDREALQAYSYKIESFSNDY